MEKYKQISINSHFCDSSRIEEAPKCVADKHSL